MLRVRVRFDKREEKKTIRVEGLAETYPELDKPWSFIVPMFKDSIQVDLGQVFNMQSYGDMILLQTDLVVAEVWFLGDEKESAEILPFVTNNTTLFMKGGKLTSLKRSGASSRQQSLIKLNNMLRVLKEDDAFDHIKPNLRLV